MARILANDRILLVGSSGFGKSTLASWLFHLMTAGGAQAVLIDPKGEWVFPGAVVCRSPEQLAQAMPAAARIHYVPSTSERDEWVGVYEQLSPANGARHMIVWTDEAQNVCVSGAGWAPRGMKLIQTQGRFAAIGHIVCSTRPIDIERTLRTEAMHVFVLAGGLDFDDLKVIAPLFRVARLPSGRPVIASAEDLQTTLAEVPEYGCLWLDRRLKAVQVMDPLPEAIRRTAARTARQRAA